MGKSNQPTQRWNQQPERELHSDGNEQLQQRDIQHQRRSQQSFAGFDVDAKSGDIAYLSRRIKFHSAQRHQFCSRYVQL